MAAGFSVEPNLRLRKLAQATGVLALIGATPMLTQIVGIRFLPSTAWVADSVWFAWGSGVLSAVIFTTLLARGWSRVEPDKASLKYPLLLLFSPFFFGLLGKDAVVVGGPMLYTMIAGTPTELPYVVERATGFSDRKCRNKIELVDMPLLHDELCGFPKEFRDRLRPGLTVIVSGRGSSLGTFVSSVRVADAP